MTAKSFVCSALRVLFVPLMVLAPVPPSRAQALEVTININEPFSTTLGNPCTGEDIQLTGNIQGVIHETRSDSGNTLVHITETVPLIGVGSDTGATYRGNIHAAETLSLAKGASETLVEHFEITASGKGNNLTLTLFIHVTANANGDVTVDNEIQAFSCK